ncbi:MAG: preQ(1) synthase [Candidatus Promineifilaceae bacterium]
MSKAEQKKESGMTQEGDLAGLSMLGKGKTVPARNLETFPNRHPDRDYVVTLSTDEFTCMCPVTGQPDFATITIKYIPNRRIVESKSLKLYLWSYRNEGVFHEHVTNVILEDLVDALEPRWCEVTADFSVRGGIDISITAEYTNPESSG